jgi:hypothetical protein
MRKTCPWPFSDPRPQSIAKILKMVNYEPFVDGYLVLENIRENILPEQ